MVAINMGNVYVTSGTVSGDTITGGITVQIDQQKIDHTLTNKVIEFNIPIPPGNKEVEAPDAQLIDLKNIKHVFSLQGVLVSDSDESAFEKKQNLMVLAGLEQLICCLLLIMTVIISVDSYRLYLKV